MVSEAMSRTLGVLSEWGSIWIPAGSSCERGVMMASGAEIETGGTYATFCALERRGLVERQLELRGGVPGDCWRATAAGFSASGSKGSSDRTLFDCVRERVSKHLWIVRLYNQDAAAELEGALRALREIETAVEDLGGEGLWGELKSADVFRAAGVS